MGNTLTQEKGSKCAEVTLVFEEEGFIFASGPEIYRKGQTLLRDYVMPQEVAHKVYAFGLVQLSIQIRNLANIVCNHEHYSS